MNLYPKSTKPDEFFLVTQYFARPLAYPLALLFRGAGWSANAVTILAGLCWVASVPATILAGWWLQNGHNAPGWAALLAAALLWNAGFILDVADGSLARMTDSAGAPGFFLDFSFHLVFNTMFLASLGIFLYMITANPLYAILAALSTCCNWGLSFSAKEHVLCEEIAKRRYRPGRLSPEEEYGIFIDSPRMKAPVAGECAPPGLARRLIVELIGFPGQFLLFGLAAPTDFALSLWLPQRFPVLKIMFVLVTLVQLVRVPARLRREFRTMQRYEALRREEKAKE